MGMVNVEWGIERVVRTVLRPFDKLRGARLRTNELLSLTGWELVRG